MTGTSHEDRYTVLITSRAVILQNEICFRQNCRENQNTHFMFINFFFFFRKSYL